MNMVCATGPRPKLPASDFTVSFDRRFDDFLPVRGQQDDRMFHPTFVPIDQSGLWGPFAFSAFPPAKAIALKEGSVKGPGENESQRCVVHAEDLYWKCHLVNNCIALGWFLSPSGGWA